MNKKSNGLNEKFKGVKNFFKKEGFYVALFVGLCVITIGGAIAIKSATNNKEDQSQTQSQQEITLNVEENKEGKVDSVMENSERVDSTQNNKKEENKQTSQAVGNTNKMNFTKPVDGILLQGHNEPYLFKDGKVVKDGEKGDSSYSYGGISVKAKLGTPVKVAEAGVVDEIIENDVTYGVTVVVKHANGMKTSYANLDKALKVKKGDKVTKGQEIGKIGNTSSTLKMCVKEDFLHLKVLLNKNNKYTEVDPLKYFNYKK
ncbi:M23 family metallopeptidase [Clostridium sp.]|uniref:M23 family metallopeptidase n=1 Tax=Clostridium sp. TaxID=1506 RepID=UPI0026DB7F00|nr:M23 family metallopeptidase [Clostridium sp.]MDO5039588.1 M23 family metallopeptidase [Clostridium sp.]